MLLRNVLILITDEISDFCLERTMCKIGWRIDPVVDFEFEGVASLVSTCWAHFEVT